MYPARTAPSPDASWFSVGLESSFLDTTGKNATALAACSADGAKQSGCKVFLLPIDSTDSVVQISQDPQSQVDASLRTGRQVLVFKYNGKFHAVDNKCPHSSYPLSNATPFDIEDFGIVLSAGITCPKHDWSFDLFTGTSDRGNYRLNIWEVQLRPAPSSVDEPGELEVWVRKRQRIG